MAGKVRPVQQWPSPWPYDFPVAGAATEAKDKVERLAVKDPAPPLPVTRRAVFASTVIGMRNRSEVESGITSVTEPPPEELWSEVVAWKEEQERPE